MTNPENTPRDLHAESATKSPRAWIVLIIAAAGLLTLQISIRPFAVNHDAALYLECGRQLIQGMRPYVDFADLNPPMIMYVSAAPAWVAQLFSAPLIPVFHGFVLALVLYSAFLAFHFLRSDASGLDSVTPGLAALAIILFSSLLLLTTNVDWGQREHLFLLVYIPFFLCRSIRWEGKQAGTAVPLIVGLLAAIGACLKPHFVVMALAVEGFHLLRTRAIKPLLAPEMITFVLGGAAYAVHFLLLPGEVRQTYFDYLLPMIQQGYGTYNVPMAEVLTHPGFALALGVVVIALIRGWRVKGMLKTISSASAVFSLVGIVLYLQQQKGWTYHLIPSVFGAIAALCAVEAARWQQAREKAAAGSPNQVRFIGWVGMGSLVATGLLLWIVDGVQPDPLERTVITEVIRQATGEQDRVLMLSTTVGEIYPLLLLADRAPGSRYLWTFPIPMLYADRPGNPDGTFPYPDRAALDENEERFLDELGEDIESRRPALILIDAYEHPQGCPAGFTLPGYFSAVSFLEREMMAYEYWQDVFGWQVYRLSNVQLPREVVREPLAS